MFSSFYSCFLSHHILNSYMYFKTKHFYNPILRENTDLPPLHSLYNIPCCPENIIYHIRVLYLSKIQSPPTSSPYFPLELSSFNKYTKKYYFYIVHYHSYILNTYHPWTSLTFQQLPIILSTWTQISVNKYVYHKWESAS